MSMGDDDSESVFLFFGSSVTSMFSLLNCDSVRINRFSGATAKGLGQENENSKSIEHVILKKYSHTPIHTLFWMFGSIDVKFSYYFRICRKDTIDPDVAMTDCAAKYMSFVCSMHAKTNAKTVVIGCEPNGAPPDRVYAQMLKYGIVLDTPFNRRAVCDAVQAHHPDLLRQKFNNTLKEICRANGFHYIDIDSEILKKDALHLDSNLSIVKDEHVDISDICVHLNWESNVVKYIPQLHKLGLLVEETADLENTRREYIDEKLNRREKKRPRLARGVADM
jgi:hypothetical protein